MRTERDANQALAAQAVTRIAQRMVTESERAEWAHVLRRSNPGRRHVIKLGLFARLAATIAAATIIGGCGGQPEPLDHNVTTIPVNCAASDACTK